MLRDIQNALQVPYEGTNKSKNLKLTKMFGEFITKMFIKMTKITNSLLVWMFLVMLKLQRSDH